MCESEHVFMCVDRNMVCVLFDRQGVCVCVRQREREKKETTKTSSRDQLPQRMCVIIFMSVLSLMHVFAVF